eukprot:88418-Alexandrium_andersonii.AAC.1
MHSCAHTHTQGTRCIRDTKHTHDTTHRTHDTTHRTHTDTTHRTHTTRHTGHTHADTDARAQSTGEGESGGGSCLLYTSDAADDM